MKKILFALALSVYSLVPAHADPLPKEYIGTWCDGLSIEFNEIKHGEYHKNVTVKYQCEQFDTKKVSNEVVELGFTNSNHLL